jgi:hypothetical protein
LSIRSEAFSRRFTGNFEKDGELKDITIKLGDLSLNQLNDLIIKHGNVKVSPE